MSAADDLDAYPFGLSDEQIAKAEAFCARHGMTLQGWLALPPTQAADVLAAFRRQTDEMLAWCAYLEGVGVVARERGLL